MENGTRDYISFLSGDQEGLTRLVRDYRDGLVLYLNGIVKNLETAEELTEEIFVKLILKKPRFASNSSFKTWLYAIGRNMAISYLRRNKTVQISLEDCPELTDAELDLERHYLRMEQKRLLHGTIRKLKPEYAQVLWLVYFEGFSNKETARIMGKTVHNTETLVYRARQALKRKLLEEGYDENEVL